MRVLVDEITKGVIEELKTLHKVQTTKEMVEKCILFCYNNKVELDRKNPKGINDLYILVEKLNKNIDNLPLKIAMVLENENDL